MPDGYPPNYLEGLRLFNAEEFFEAHDAWEELWAESIGDQKRFLQGLIQASVSLFHFGNENYGGAKKLYEACRAKLEPFRAAPFMGLDVNAFLTDYETCFAELMNHTEKYPTGLLICDELVPKIPIPDDVPA